MTIVDTLIESAESMPWCITEDNDLGLRVVDAYGNTVHEKEWISSDEMPSAMREQIIQQDRTNACFMVSASNNYGELLKLLADIKEFDIQNYVLDLPLDIRVRIQRALS